MVYWDLVVCFLFLLFLYYVLWFSMGFGLFKKFRSGVLGLRLLVFWCLLFVVVLSCLLFRRLVLLVLGLVVRR